MKKIELAKEFTDMVKRHAEEALLMATKIGGTETTEDSKEVLIASMKYATSLSTKSEIAQSDYSKIAIKFIESETEKGPWAGWKLFD